MVDKPKFRINGTYITLGALVAGSIIALPAAISTYQLIVNSPDGSELSGPIIYLGTIWIVTALCLSFWLTDYDLFINPWIPAVAWFFGQCLVWIMNGLGIFRLLASWASWLEQAPLQ